MALRTRNGLLDWAVRVVGLLAVGAMLFLGYTIWDGQRAGRDATLATRAVAVLEQAVRDNPDSAQARLLLADAYRDIGRLNPAVEQYTKVLEIDSTNVGALSGLAMIAMQREDWRTAEGYWLSAIDVVTKNPIPGPDPRLEQAYYLYGTVLIQLGEFEDAIGYLREAARIRRDNADIHYALAYAYREIGETEAQRTALETALAFVPRMPEANYDLGVVLLAEGDRAGAAERFRIAIDGAPGRPEPLDALLELGPFADRLADAQRLASSDPAAALVEARISVALEPENAEGVRVVARLLQQTDADEDAISAWERLLELVPNDPEATSALEALR